MSAHPARVPERLRDPFAYQALQDKVGHVIAGGGTATEAIAPGRRPAAAIHVRTGPVA